MGLQPGQLCDAADSLGVETFPTSKFCHGERVACGLYETAEKEPFDDDKIVKCYHQLFGFAIKAGFSKHEAEDFRSWAKDEV